MKEKIVKKYLLFTYKNRKRLNIMFLISGTLIYLPFSNTDFSGYIYLAFVVSLFNKEKLL